MESNYIENLKSELINREFDQDYIDRCVNYAKRLINAELPVIFDARHLSLLLGINYSRLLFLAFGDKDTLYRTVRIKKKRGGYRTLSIPAVIIKYIQKWTLDEIVSKMKVSDAATGFIKGASIKENASLHLNSKCILNLDIKDFFPSINKNDVYRIFYYYGYTDALSDILSEICTFNDQLPQGAPTSPQLSNIRCIKMDKRIQLLCKAYNANYSRYADDITISGSGNLEKIKNIVIEIIRDEGFEINTRKTRILYPHQRQEITGLVINNGIIKVPKEYKRELRKEIYFCKKYGPTSHQEHIGDGHSFLKEHLYGKAYYIKMIEPTVGEGFLSELDEIDWNR